MSLRAPLLIKQGGPLSSEALAEYWIASRCRFDQWGRELRVLGQSQTAPPTDASDLLSRLAEEMTLSEPLTRIVAAVCVVHDARCSAEEAAPIGVNLLQAHRDVISRLRALTFAWWPSSAPRALHARSMARQADQWADVLLAYLTPLGDVERFAIDASRLREFAYDSQVHGAASSETADALLGHALRMAFAAATRPTVCGDLNRRIAGATLGLFGPEAFDGHGLARPLWMLRAERTADDTAALIDRLFVDGSDEGALRLPARWRI